MRVARRTSRMLVAALALGAGGLVAQQIACSGEPTTQYGNPAGLSRGNLPGEAGIQLIVCDAGPLDGGLDGGCPVSWSSDLFPKIASAGAWKCASTGSCHGGVQAPHIDASTPGAAYKSLQGFIISGSPYPYINADSGDPTQSTIECNLAQGCGNGMPLPPGVPLTHDELCAVDTWVRCGAPGN